MRSQFVVALLGLALLGSADAAHRSPLRRRLFGEGIKNPCNYNDVNCGSIGNIDLGAIEIAVKAEAAQKAAPEIQAKADAAAAVVEAKEKADAAVEAKVKADAVAAVVEENKWQTKVPADRINLLA